MKSRFKITVAAIGLASTVIISAAAAPLSDKIVAVDNLAGKVVLLHLDVPKMEGHKAVKPVDPKSKVAPVEYTVVPNVKCTLLSDVTLLDSREFALYPFSQRVVGAPIK
jgi:hypothetical protein